MVGDLPTEAGPPERRPATSPLRPGETLGGYVIEREVARGGMGIVYCAADVSLGRSVALKVIAPALAADRVFRERFRRESRLAARVEHPAVVPVYRAGQEQGRLFIAMRFVEGTDLATVLRERGALAPAEAVALAGQIAGALDAAHARGLVHRDVKPANVLLSPDARRAFLTDFGLTLELDEGSGLTRTGNWVGTLAYAAPEQLRGDAVDACTDVYALGGVLHHCLTGQVPYPVARELDAVSAHLLDPPPRPSDIAPGVPRALDAVVARAMSKDPAARFRSAGDLARAADAAARGDPAPRHEQSVATGAAVRDPTHASAVKVRTNLPPPAAPLVGRERDVQDLTAILVEPDSRIVTVTGPGGIGKTRLALEAARSVLHRFPDGVFVVELEAVPDAAAVPAAIARALALPEQRGVMPLSRVTSHVRDRRLLLVLDNFEHLIAAGPDMARLVADAPDSRLLVTSQAPLHLSAERVVPVRPLELPEIGEHDLDAVAASPSVALLLQRARSVDPNVALTSVNAAAIGELCRRLEGLPLALELAAARLALLDPRELLERLGSGVDALGRGARDAPARQRGLRATLDWTTSQLNDSQRTLFTELAVFVGGFTLRLGEAIGRGDVLEDLAALREMSLVRRDAARRFSMSPPVRLYALDLLHAAGRDADARDRHSEAILELVTEHDEGWVWDFRRAMQALYAEAENVREALRWTRTRDPRRHGQLAAAVTWFFANAGYDSEAVDELDAALALNSDPVLGARLLTSRALVEMDTGNVEAFRRAVAACRETRDDRTLVWALFGLTEALGLRREGAPALVAAREAQAVARELGDPSRSELAELAMERALGTIGDVEAARSVAASILSRAGPESFFRFFVSTSMADVALIAGDWHAALAGYCRCLHQLQNLGSPPNQALQLDGAATALARLGRGEEALVTAMISDRMRSVFSFAAAPTIVADRDAALAAVSDTLDPPRQRQCVAWAAELGIDGGLAWAAELAEDLDPIGGRSVP